MVKLTTVKKAKKEIQRLKIFVKLAESCNPETVDQMMIKEYAYLGSLKKVSEKLNHAGTTINGFQIESSDVSDAIKAKGSDELHKIVRSSYLYRTRASKKKYKDTNW